MQGAKQFVKKPVVIRAVQFTGNTHELVRAFPKMVFESSLHDANLLIETLEGNITASPGDWIIEGVHGEYYPCKPDIFEKTYEKVSS